MAQVESTRRTVVGRGVDPLRAQNLLLNITQQGYSETKLEHPMGFGKQGTDADEEDDGKTLADEVYSYIRELEYMDGLEEADEEARRSPTDQEAREARR